MISRVDVRLAPGVDRDIFARHLQEMVPAGVVVEQPEASLAASARASRAYRVNMTVLALVALFTGALLVFSTQSLAVVRRRAQLALLRVLGVTRGQVQRMLLAEGMLIGIAGSALGLLGGYGLAQFAVSHLGADLGVGCIAKRGEHAHGSGMGAGRVFRHWRRRGRAREHVACACCGLRGAGAGTEGRRR